MRVGFITQLLWPRYGAFWEKLLVGVAAEPIFAEPQAVQAVLQDKKLQDIPGVIFRLAVAEALALEESDVIIAPDLNPGEDSARGSGQDPWIASFPEALAKSFAGLPPIISVPASLEDNLETLVISTLQSLTHDPGLVRRVWERNRASARPPRYEPRWQLRPAQGGMPGLLGQPWLLSDQVVQKLKNDDRHIVSQHQLKPDMLRREGKQVDERLVATDSEVLGAARFLGRKGSISRLIMLADKTSGADAWLLSRIQRLVHKPLELVYVQDLLSPAEFVSMFLERRT